MCIIAYKPAGLAFPKKSILQTCFLNNPDGAGFMYNDGAGVVIKKGFKTFNAFYEALKQARLEAGNDPSYVLHFRISTQAGRRADCTHPFPLSCNMNDLRELDCRAKIGVAHNGIIQLTSDYCARNITYSDTMKFITDYLYLIIDGADYYTHKNKILLIDRLCGSRLAILDGRGHCELIGAGWQESGGIWYSNGSWKSSTTTAEKPAKKAAPSLYDDFLEEFIADAWDGEMFDFHEWDCPAQIDGDFSYCDLCRRYGGCFGGEA